MPLHVALHRSGERIKTGNMILISKTKPGVRKGRTEQKQFISPDSCFFVRSRRPLGPASLLRFHDREPKRRTPITAALQSCTRPDKSAGSLRTQFVCSDPSSSASPVGGVNRLCGNIVYDNTSLKPPGYGWATIEGFDLCTQTLRVSSPPERIDSGLYPSNK